MIIAIHPQTAIKPYSSVRVFENAAIAVNCYGKQCKNLWPDPDILAKRMSPARIRETIIDLYNEFDGEEVPSTAKGNDFDLPDPLPKTPLGLAHLLWDLCLTYGDYVKGYSENSEASDLYHFDLAAIKAAEKEWPSQKQAKVILQMALKRNAEALTERELTTLVGDLHRAGVLKTKQDPWRIFMYYCVDFGKRGWVRYPGMRNKEEDQG